MTDKKDFLAKTLTYWDKITVSEQQRIIEGTTEKNFSAGQSVRTPTSSCDGMYIVKSGGLRVYLISDDGKEFPLYRLEEGDVCVLTATCILSSISFDVYIDAEVDSQLLRIDYYLLRQLHKENPIIENFALKSTVEKFSAVIHGIENMYFLPIEQRLAIFLTEEYEKHESTKIALTHEQIGKYIGSAREVVSRAVKKLEKDKIVSLSRGVIEIVDLDSLYQLSEINT